MTDKDLASITEDPKFRFGAVINSEAEARSQVAFLAQALKEGTYNGLSWKNGSGAPFFGIVGEPNLSAFTDRIVEDAVAGNLPIAYSAIFDPDVDERVYLEGLESRYQFFIKLLEEGHSTRARGAK